MDPMNEAPDRPTPLEIEPCGANSQLVRMRGDIDIATMDDLEHALSALDEGGSVIVDLSEVGFMDSSGIALLLRINRTAGSLLIRDPAPVVRLVIEATGLAEVLPMTP